MKINFKIRGSPEELAEFFRKIREIKIITVSDDGRENTVLRRSRETLRNVYDEKERSNHEKDSVYRGSQRS